jgi:hypothetical protein
LSYFGALLRNEAAQAALAQPQPQAQTREPFFIDRSPAGFAEVLDFVRAGGRFAVPLDTLEASLRSAIVDHLDYLLLAEDPVTALMPHAFDAAHTSRSRTLAYDARTLTVTRTETVPEMADVRNSYYLDAKPFRAPFARAKDIYTGHEVVFFPASAVRDGVRFRLTSPMGAYVWLVLGTVGDAGTGVEVMNLKSTNRVGSLHGRVYDAARGAQDLEMMYEPDTENGDDDDEYGASSDDVLSARAATASWVLTVMPTPSDNAAENQDALFFSVFCDDGLERQPKTGVRFEVARIDATDNLRLGLYLTTTGQMCSVLTQ